MPAQPADDPTLKVDGGMSYGYGYDYIASYGGYGGYGGESYSYVPAYVSLSPQQYYGSPYAFDYSNYAPKGQPYDDSNASYGHDSDSSYGSSSGGGIGGGGGGGSFPSPHGSSAGSSLANMLAAIERRLANPNAVQPAPPGQTGGGGTVGATGPLGTYYGGTAPQSSDAIFWIIGGLAVLGVIVWFMMEK